MTIQRGGVMLLAERVDRALGLLDAGRITHGKWRDGEKVCALVALFSEVTDSSEQCPTGAAARAAAWDANARAFIAEIRSIQLKTSSACIASPFNANDPYLELRCELDRIHDAYPSVRWTLGRDEIGLFVEGRSLFLVSNPKCVLKLRETSIGQWIACHQFFPHVGQWPNLIEACASVHDAHVLIMDRVTDEYTFLRGEV